MTCSGTPSLLVDSEFIRLGLYLQSLCALPMPPSVLGGGVDVGAVPELSTSGDVS